MAESTVSAEIEPLPGRAQAAAKALQQLGLRVLHIGQTISVEGSERVWRSTFHVAFTSRKKTIIAGIGESEVTYRTAAEDTLSIPSQLRGLVAAVSFVEPPELL